MGDLDRDQDDASLGVVSDAGEANVATVHALQQVEGVAVVTFPAPLVTVDPSVLAGAAITVVDDGRRVAPLVAGLLRSHGASAQVVEPGRIPEISDGIIHLGQLHSGKQAASDLFDEVYPVAKAGATTVVTVTGLGGMHGQDQREGGQAAECGPRGGFCPHGKLGQADRFDQADRLGHADRLGQPAGWMQDADHPPAADPTAEVHIAACGGIGSLLGELAEELPGANVRAVDLDCFDDPVVLAGRIVAEALACGGPVAVGYRDDRRCTVVPAGEAGTPESSELQLNWGSMGRVTDHHLDEGLLLIG
ncbi:MAG TPA: hypothetical protein VNV87_12525 [Acidimicrobiales bacterium]|nr:hypothetical protein [Acidimicrobiales bacterium]